MADNNRLPPGTIPGDEYELLNPIDHPSRTKGEPTFLPAVAAAVEAHRQGLSYQEYLDAHARGALRPKRK